MKESIINTKKGGFHGYQEYYYNSHLRFRGNWKRHMTIGYVELHNNRKTIYSIV